MIVSSGSGGPVVIDAGAPTCAPGFTQTGAFGSLYSEGVQFGYNFKDAPVTVHAGFDTLKSSIFF